MEKPDSMWVRKVFMAGGQDSFNAMDADARDALSLMYQVVTGRDGLVRHALQFLLPSYADDERTPHSYSEASN